VVGWRSTSIYAGAVGGLLFALSLGSGGCENAKPGAQPSTGGAAASGGAGGAGATGAMGGAGGALVPGPSGSIDETFGASGFAFVDFGSIDTSWGVGVDASGRIVFAGNSNAAVSTFAIARLEPDGDVDETFGTFGLANTSFGNDYDGAEAVLLQPDGRIIAAGTTFSTDVLNGVSGFALARYTEDGTLDTTFGDGGKAVSDIKKDFGILSLANAATIDDAGRAIVVGSGTEIVLARYTPAGKLDGTFGSTGLVTAAWSDDEMGTVGNHVALDGSGRIVVAGRQVSSGGAESPYVARFLAGGALDTSFGTDGFALLTIPFDGAFSVVVVDETAAIVAAGVSDDQWFVARFGDAGAIDPTFGADGVAWIGAPAKRPTALVPIAGDVIVTGTYAGEPSCPCGSGCDNRCGSFAAVRLDASGSIDPGFGTGGLLEVAIGPNDYMTAATLDAAGRVVVTGHTDFGSGFDFAATRFWP
jgi:uncharacterized delta-60 repeat protein